MTDAGVAQLCDARKRFRRRGPWVLDGVSVAFDPGTTTAIIGTNGSGKSTLLKALAGVTRLTSGTARTPITVGYVPERIPARLRMTGIEYLAHMGRIRGLAGAAVKARASELFERFDLQPNPDTPFEALSKGNRQKVMLAQAFLGPVELLVLDEPFSGLDVAAHGSLRDLLDQARSAGSTVVESAHHPSSVSSADLVWSIAGGRIEEVSVDPGPTALRLHAIARVVLARSDESGDPAAFTGLPGVGVLHDGRSSLVLSVDRAILDDLLLRALRTHWSVAAVGSDEPSAGPEGPGR